MTFDGVARCMAEAKDGRWWAICIDFDIAVQGGSFAAVREALSEATSLYLERVSEMEPEEQHRFLGRRAPWHVRAKFHLQPLLAKLRGHDGERHRQFEIPAHA